MKPMLPLVPFVVALRTGLPASLCHQCSSRPYLGVCYGQLWKIILACVLRRLRTATFNMCLFCSLEDPGEAAGLQDLCSSFDVNQGQCPTVSFVWASSQPSCLIWRDLRIPTGIVECFHIQLAEQQREQQKSKFTPKDECHSVSGKHAGNKTAYRLTKYDWSSQPWSYKLI